VSWHVPRTVGCAGSETSTRVSAVEGGQHGRCGRVSDVDGDEPRVATGHVGRGARDGHGEGAIAQGDSAKEGRAGRIAHVHDQQLLAVGHVRQGSGDGHVAGTPWRLVGAEERGVGRIGDIDDPEPGTAVGHVDRAPRDRDLRGVRDAVEGAEQGGVGRIGDVDDDERAVVGRHVGRGARDRHVLCGVGQKELARLRRVVGIGDVVDAQPVEIRREGVAARDGEGARRLVEQAEVGEAHRRRADLRDRRLDHPQPGEQHHAQNEDPTGQRAAKRLRVHRFSPFCRRPP